MEIKSEDEIGTLGKAFNQMILKFQESGKAVVQLKSSLTALVADANMLSAAAVEGKLATRADASKHQGDFCKIVQGVDDCLDAVIGPLNVAAKYVYNISKGNIPPKITDSYNGDFNVLKNNLNTCIDAVNNLVADAAMLAQAGTEEKLQTRADAAKHQGDFRKIVDGVNGTLDAVIVPINEAQEVLEKVADRDMSARVKGDYKGDLAKIKTAINTAVDNLDDALSQVVGATEQVSSASQQISAGCGDTLIVEARQHQFSVRNVLDASGNSYSWHMQSTDGKSDINAVLKDGKISVKGIFNKKKVDKSATPDALNPWSQDFTQKIHALCQSQKKSTLISAFNPMDFSLMQFEATDKGVETVSVNGQKVEARHMRIGLTGILALAWHGDYWFRKSDCRFVRYEGTNGPPGSPKTTIELIEEK